MHSPEKVSNINSVRNLIKFILSTYTSWILIAPIVIITDRYTKLWMITHLAYHEPLRILPILNFTLYYNTGAAFGFLHTATGWQNLLLGSIAVVVSMMLFIWMSMSTLTNWMHVACCLIIGGAIGNVWDRIQYGHVIDFLSWHFEERYFAIFNIADSAICVGALIVIWCSFGLRNQKSD